MKRHFIQDTSIFGKTAIGCRAAFVGLLTRTELQLFDLVNVCWVFAGNLAFHEPPYDFNGVEVEFPGRRPPLQGLDIALRVQNTKK